MNEIDVFYHILNAFDLNIVGFANEILAANNVDIVIIEIIPGDRGFTVGFTDKRSARRFLDAFGERAYMSEPAKEPWYVTVAVEQSQ